MVHDSDALISKLTSSSVAKIHTNMEKTYPTHKKFELMQKLSAVWYSYMINKVHVQVSLYCGEFKKNSLVPAFLK